jgi:hypothetical protein
MVVATTMPTRSCPAPDPRSQSPTTRAAVNPLSRAVNRSGGGEPTAYVREAS